MRPIPLTPRIFSAAVASSVLLTIKFVPSREEFLESFLPFTQSSDSRNCALFASFAAYFQDLKRLSSVPFVKPLFPLWLAFGCGFATLWPIVDERCVPVPPQPEQTGTGYGAVTKGFNSFLFRVPLELAVFACSLKTVLEQITKVLWTKGQCLTTLLGGGKAVLGEGCRNVLR